jgi:predicted TIM-barrel fold metal-dependent hydrolase
MPLTIIKANAIDYRSRIAYQKELEETLRGLLDQDIVEQVEAEGWITRIGRLFKAGVRMMERVQEERATKQPSLNERIDQLGVERLELQVEVLAEENAKLRGVLEAMRELLDGGNRS